MYKRQKELCETLEKEMISLMSPDLQAMFEDYKEYTLNLKQTELRDALSLIHILFIRNGADLGERLHSVWSKLCYRFNGNKTEAIQR